jgi:hypothetical protein
LILKMDPIGSLKLIFSSLLAFFSFLLPVWSAFK